MMRLLREFAFVVMVLAGSLTIAKAAEPPQQNTACADNVPEDMRTLWHKVCDSPSKDRTLAEMHAATAALARHHLPLATDTFDHVLAAIEAIYADTPTAEKARSLWNAEAVKDFKGEPYERMMAYYYRGVLALAAGDWDTAQASFQGGILQDTMAQDQRFRADTAALIWLQGWAEHCRGNDLRAAELFTEAKGINPSLTPPEKADRLLFLAETGTAPLKFRAGKHGEKLGIREGMAGNYGLTAQVDGRTVALERAEDLFFQATTRGGRPVDTILADKANSKDAVGDLGRAAMIAGAGTMVYAANNRSNNDNNAAAIGLALILIGAMAQAAADNIDAHADTRVWGNLPHSLHLGSAPPADKLNREMIALFDPAGRPVLSTPEEVLLSDNQSCQLVRVGNMSITPSLAMPVRGAGPGPGQAGNCRTGDGSLAMLPPDTCRRIGGESLVDGMLMNSAGQAGSRFSSQCQTSTGSVTELSADTCRKIGGEPL